MTVRAQKVELQQLVKETGKRVEQNHQLYLEEQQKHQSTRISHKVVKNGVNKLREYNCYKASSGLIR
jgi:hypothetical protein